MANDTRNEMQLEPIFISVEEAAQILGISKWSCYNLLDQQRFESRYLGRRRLVVVESLRAYARSLPNYPPSERATRRS